jgi:hypothetical protein
VPHAVSKGHSIHTTPTRCRGKDRSNGRTKQCIQAKANATTMKSANERIGPRPMPGMVRVVFLPLSLFEQKNTRVPKQTKTNTSFARVSGNLIPHQGTVCLSVPALTDLELITKNAPRASRRKSEVECCFTHSSSTPVLTTPVSLLLGVYRDLDSFSKIQALPPSFVQIYINLPTVQQHHHDHCYNHGSIQIQPRHPLHAQDTATVVHIVD